MAKRIPIPFVPDSELAGLDCSICWGSGKPFGDGDTPEAIFVRLSGVNEGPAWTGPDGDPLNNLYRVPQKPFVPCQYQLGPGVFRILITFTAGRTQANLRNFSGRITFTADIFSDCLTLMDNEQTGIFENGSMKIFIPGITS